jgi:hypothetical protein
MDEKTYFKIDLAVPREIPAGNSSKNQIKIQDFLNLFLEEEILAEFTCDNCMTKTCWSSTLQHWFTMTSDIMVFFLKWFVYVPDSTNPENLIAEKVNTEITEYMTIKIPVHNAVTSSSSTYGLCGIVFHHGHSKNSGHFTFVGRASSCVARKCNGMMNATQSCEEHGWRFWNDAVVSEPLCFNDAVQRATEYTNPSFGTDGHPILKSDKFAPAMLFYTRLGDDNGSDDSQVPQWALCNRGDAWRAGI